MQVRKVVALCGLMAVLIFNAGCATTMSKVAYIVSGDQAQPQSRFKTQTAANLSASQICQGQSRRSLYHRVASGWST